MEMANKVKKVKKTLGIFNLFKKEDLVKEVKRLVK